MCNKVLDEASGVRLGFKPTRRIAPFRGFMTCVMSSALCPSDLELRRAQW